MYSMFYETEINYGGEGGLYAEMVRNRDFEYLGRGATGAPASEAEAEEERTEFLKRSQMSKEELRHYIMTTPPLHDGLDPQEPAAIPTDFRPWTAVGTANLSISTDAPFNQNPHSLRVITTKAGDGVANGGYWGMSLAAEMGYNITFFAKSADVKTVSFALLCTGATALPSASIAVTSTWLTTAYTTSIYVPTARSNCSLQVLAGGAGQIVLDHVSMVPQDAVEGLFRKDLFDFLKDMAPPQVRLPGGLYMEGSGLRTRWNWKNTVGPKQQRAGHYNTIWRYWVTDGFGMPEMLRLTELIGAKPLIAVYTGYSPYSNYVPLNESHDFARDARDLIQFCNGDETTLWGKVRIENGLTNPIGLKRLEVGNEESIQGTEGYGGHYQLITSTIWQAYPGFEIVASGTLAVQGFFNRSTSCFPCIGGCGMAPQHCDSWDEHTYMIPSGIANLSTIYDNYLSPEFCETTTGGRCPDINVLEYASRNLDNTMNMVSTTGDAVFLIGMERNAAYVKATAYAPLFANVHYTLWQVNLINFNQSHSFANPSYYLQKLFRDNTGVNTLKVSSTGGPTEVGLVTWNASASVGSDGLVIIKAANFGNFSVDVDVTFEGFEGMTLDDNALVMLDTSGTGSDGNSLDNPKKVVPTTKPLPQVVGNKFTLTMPSFSVWVVRGHSH